MDLLSLHLSKVLLTGMDDRQSIFDIQRVLLPLEWLSLLWRFGMEPPANLAAMITVALRSASA